MMKKIFATVSIFFLLNMNVAALAKPQKLYSQLEVRQMQTHLVDTNDTMKVQKAVFAALQDNGFIITTFEHDMGYTTAISDSLQKRTDKKRVAGYSAMIAYYAASIGICYGMNPAGYYGIVDSSFKIKNELQKKLVVVTTNVVVEPFGDQTKIRISLVERVHVHADGHSYYKPAIRTARRIYDPLIYQNLFAEVDKSLFLEKNNL